MKQNFLLNGCLREPYLYKVHLHIEEVKPVDIIILMPARLLSYSFRKVLRKAFGSFLFELECVRPSSFIAHKGSNL